MRMFVHMALLVRGGIRDGAGYAYSLGLAALVCGGAFRPGEGPTPVVIASLAGGFVVAAWIRVPQLQRAFRMVGSLRGRLEQPFLLLAASAAAVQALGGIGSIGAPLMFIAVAGISSLSTVRVGMISMVAAGLLGLGVWLAGGNDVGVWSLVLHTVFLVVFGLLSQFITRVEIARARSHSEQALEEERARVKDDARLFRLVSPSSVTEPADDERLFRSSLEEVHSATFHILELLKETLGLYTCVLLFLDQEKKKLRIVELATDSDDIADGPFSRGEGAVGAVLNRGLVTNLEQVRPGYSGLCYYKGPAPVRSFVGVPVNDGATPLGVLCCDRRDEVPFTIQEESLLKTAVLQVLRTLENERVFVQLERQKREQTVLYRTSQNLGAALTEDEVLGAGLAAAGELVPHDLCVITEYDATANRHTIIRAMGDGAEVLEDLSFRDNSSLTAMVVKNQHYLPYRGDFDPAQQIVFTKRTRLQDLNSLLVMPLVVREDAVGTMVLAARRTGAFGDALRPTLQLLANQMAVALSNAKAVERLEQMATTDGLTGCLNKRAFLDELDQKFRASARFGRQMALIVTDIDFFKSVNDTYGHATGDVVLRGLATILKSAKRETDVVARFGGEEFCVLCEETDEEGALLLAERIREDLEAHVFETEMGKLQVTTSLGVATFPVDAKSTEQLFERADKALYAAKRNGRNQVASAGGGTLRKPSEVPKKTRGWARQAKTAS